MIIYSIEMFDKVSEELIREITIPEFQLEAVAKLMGWNAVDKESFFNGVGGFNVTKEQAEKLEVLLGVAFYSEQFIIQIAGGEV